MTGTTSPNGRFARLAALAFLGLIAAGPASTLPVRAETPAGAAMERTITLSASGTASAVPDMATVNLGVVSEASEAAAALSANTAAMSKIIEALKAAGVAARDLQTANVSVNPRYDYPGDGRAPHLVGYQVSNGLTVRIRNLADTGRILDLVVGLGSNQVNGISFGFSKPEEVADEARRNAFANARARAELYAAAAGVKLGQVVSIAEGSRGQGPRPLLRGRAMAADAAAPVPIEAGESELSVEVTVVWAIE
ncbi:MAG: SIMPL domain-containing protein [Hyphomicrobiaceae bacterium]